MTTENPRRKYYMPDKVMDELPEGRKFLDSELHEDSIAKWVIDHETPVLEIRRYGIFEVNQKFAVFGLESGQYFLLDETLQGAVTRLVDLIAPRNER